MLMADAAVCVASGTSWLPSLPGETIIPLTVKQCPTLWVDYDNGTRRTLDRFGALARARNLPEDAPIAIFPMASPWLDANSITEMENLKWRITELKAKFVVIDNLGTVSGDADENSSAMIKVLGNFRKLAEETGAAVVLIHHQRKGGNSNRAGDALRGHSSIEAALDLALQVVREGGGDTIEIKSTKTRDVPVYPFSALFTFEYLSNSTDLHIARFYGVDIEPEENSIQSIDEMIFDVLHDKDKASQTEIISGVKKVLPEASNKKIRERILHNERNGIIANQGKGQRNAKQYRLAS